MSSNDLEEKLQDVPRWCKWLRIMWCDASGVRRCRIVPAARIRDAAVRGVGLTQGCMAMAAHSDSPAPDAGLTADGEIRLVPDLDTLRQVPWCESHFVTHANMRTSAGEPWDFCPREALRRALAALQSEFGVTMQVGCELEFYLLKAPDKWSGTAPEPLDDSKYCQSSSADAAAEDLEGIITAVQRLAGVTVEQFHAEGGGGQFEFATTHCDAFKAADALLLTREAVIDTAQRQGRPATLLPKPFEDRSASGSHLHFSLHKDGKALMSGGPPEAHGLQEPAEHFLSGILGHLPGLLPFLAASPNSYRRLAPSSWAGAFQAWGLNNREAALRLLPGDGDRANCELKTMDATSNPHLALAAVATAGLLGLRREGKLPPPISGDPAALSREERQRDGVRALPPSLTAGLDTLKIDKDLAAGLRETLGEPLLAAYVAVKRSEAAHFKDALLKVEQALWHRY